MDGRYEPLEPNERGCLWSQQLELFLGVHEGQLRFFTPDGELVTAPDEAALEAIQQVAQEKQRADQQQQRADRLAERLRALGIDPDDL